MGSVFFEGRTRRTAVAHASFSLLLGLGALGALSCAPEPSATPLKAPEPEAPPQRAATDAKSSPEVPGESATADLFQAGETLPVAFVTDLVLAAPTQMTRGALTSTVLKVASSSASTTWLSVDGHAPRHVGTRKLTVSDLINEDVELSPGPHWLIAVRRTADTGLSVQTHPFFVEVAPSFSPLSPGCLILTELTVNGPRSVERMSLMAVPLLVGLDRVEYEATAPGYASRSEAPPATPMQPKSPPNGDMDLSIRCYLGEEERGAATQTVTINGDAPDPESAPKGGAP